MSSWDDEDFEVDTTTAAVNNTWDDEDEDDLLDDWEAAGESEDDTPKVVKPVKNKVGAEQRKAEREAKEQAEREKLAMAKAEEDEANKRERLRQAELDSDLNNAASLFGAVDIHPRAKKAAAEQQQSKAAQPQKLSDLAIFKPTNKQEFENLRKTLVPLLQQLNEVSTVQYANFVTDLCRDVCKPIATDQIRKVSSTLTALQNEKVREERANRGKKKKPIATAASLKVDDAKDTTNYEEFDDEEDFM